MNILQYRIKSILKEFKEQQEINKDNYWYFITITFDTSTFFRRLNSISDVYKKLSNSKSGLTGNLSNREWWAKLKPSGFYDYTLTKDKIVFKMIMETQTKINELELKSRIKKICTYKNINIDFKDQDAFDKAYSAEYYPVFQSGMELFGNARGGRINRKQK